MKKYYLFLLIAFLLAASSYGGLAEQRAPINMNATALKELVIGSENSLKSYRFTLAENQYIQIINSTNGNATQQDSVLTLGAGAVNSTSRSVKVVTAILYQPVGREENANATSVEIYFLNDTLYTKVDGNWTSLKLPLPESSWASQNRIAQSAGLLNASNVRLIGVETINGENFYVVEVFPQSSAVSSLIRQLLGSNRSLFSQDINALFNNTQLRYVIWINAASHLPVLEYVQLSMAVTPEMLGYSTGAGSEIRIDSTETLRLSGFNATINIALPAAAKGAKMLPLNASMNNSSLNNASLLPSDPAATQDPSDDVGDTSNTEAEQAAWLADAYAFLNGGYYPYYSPAYSYPYMPYSPYYNPYYSYSPHYNPDYNTYYTPYYSPYYGQSIIPHYIQ